MSSLRSLVLLSALLACAPACDLPSLDDPAPAGDDDDDDDGGGSPALRGDGGGIGGSASCEDACDKLVDCLGEEAVLSTCVRDCEDDLEVDDDLQGCIDCIVEESCRAMFGEEGACVSSCAE